MADEWNTDPNYKFKEPQKSSSMLWTKCTSKSEVPAERHSPAITSIGSKVYLFGGSKADEAYDDFWVLDTKDWKWSPVQVKSKEKPPALWGHSINAFGGKKLFVYGGKLIGGETADLWVFDIENSSWSRPNQSGPTPPPRSYHASSVYGNRLLIFGGKQNDASLYVLNTDNMEWSRPETSGNGPDARNETSIIVHQKKLLVFGGVSLDRMETLNELHSMEFGVRNWTKHVPKGAVPERRGGHTANLVGKYVIVYGGKAGGNKGLFGEIHFGDAGDLSWSKTKGTGYKPEPRANHASTVLDNNKIFFFGGDLGNSKLTNEMLLLEV